MLGIVSVGLNAGVVDIYIVFKGGSENRLVLGLGPKLKLMLLREGLNKELILGLVGADLYATCAIFDADIVAGIAHCRRKSDRGLLL